jgi:tetratricopeptide (TPR) repeat protein
MPDSRSRARRAAALLALAGAAAAAAPCGAVAQQATPQQPDAFMRALELEQNRQHREAAAAYRQSLGTSNAIAALLGLERVYAELGWLDSTIVLADSLARAMPRNPTVRTVQLRAMRMAGRDEDARRTFERWVRESPREAAPYREYARLLLQEGRSAAADTVLQRAQRALGTGRDVALELAQLRASMGLWEPAARSWREALEDSPYLVQAATFALQPAPADARQSIRTILLAEPRNPEVRRVLAGLELAWGSPRDAWTALKDLPRTETTANAWRDFAEQAENSEAWLPARDALVAVLGWRYQPQLAVRAASNALSGGDAHSALTILEDAAAKMDKGTAARQTLALRVRALAALGRVAEAQRMADEASGLLDDAQRADLTRHIAWGWVRVGDVARARAALETTSGTGEGEAAAGWLALYEGDLKTARARLRRTSESSPDLVTALALLARTRAERAPAVGDAFLALARGDSAAAASKLVAAAPEVPEAAPLLLSTAARIYLRRRNEQGAIELWQQLLSRHETSPEAAEADLEWGRNLRRRGQHADAIKRFEHLILTYPQSALVPQARRELELSRKSVPET